MFLTSGADAEADVSVTAGTDGTDGTDGAASGTSEASGAAGAAASGASPVVDVLRVAGPRCSTAFQSVPTSHDSITVMGHIASTKG